MRDTLDNRHWFVPQQTTSNYCFKTKLTNNLVSGQNRNESLVRSIFDNFLSSRLCFILMVQTIDKTRHQLMAYLVYWSFTLFPMHKLVFDIVIPLRQMHQVHIVNKISLWWSVAHWLDSLTISQLTFACHIFPIKCHFLDVFGCVLRSFCMSVCRLKMPSNQKGITYSIEFKAKEGIQTTKS